MHMGMSHVYPEQPYGSLAGLPVGYRKNGKPIYMPGGGSTPPEPPPGPPVPPGAIPVVIPPAPQAPPQAITPEQLQQMQAQWQADADARLAAQRQELENSFSTRLAPFEAEAAERKRIADEATAAAAAAEAARLAEQETAAERAQRLNADTAAQLAAMRNELAQKDAVIAKEREFAELANYRNQQLVAHAETIHPAMHEMVQGFSQAEIDASVARAEAASEAIITEFATSLQQQQGAAALLQRQAPGARITAPPAGPLEAVASTQMLTAADIGNMEMRDYAQMRGQLMAAASAAYRGQGQ